MSSKSSISTSIKNTFSQNKIMCIAGNLKNIPSYPSHKMFYNPQIFPQELYIEASIAVLDMDCLQAANMMIRNGYVPLILNMGDDSIPGSDISVGGYTQEASLFCRSNYFKTLVPTFYPIHGKIGIYSPNVYIFRNTDLNFLINPYLASFINVAAIRNPRLEDGRLSKNDYLVTMDKLEVVFQTAMIKGYDSIVLSAFGCGNNFNNPIEDILEIFNKLLIKWRCAFKMIVFAVLSRDKKTGSYVLRKKDVNDCNYDHFKKHIRESSLIK